MTTYVANATIKMTSEKLAHLYAYLYHFELEEAENLEELSFQKVNDEEHYSFTIRVSEDYFYFLHVLLGLEFYGNIQSFEGKSIDDEYDEVLVEYVYDDGFYRKEVIRHEEYSENADYYMFKQTILEHDTVLKLYLGPGENSSVENYPEFKQLLRKSPEKADFSEALSTFIGSHSEDIIINIYNHEEENLTNSRELNTSLKYTGGELEIFFFYFVTRGSGFPEKLDLPKINNVLNTREKTVLIEMDFPSLDTKTKTILPVSFVEALLNLEESMATIKVKQGETWINPCTICENRLLKEVVGNCEVCIFGTMKNTILMV